MNRHWLLVTGLAGLSILTACATPCGILNYCDLPEGWPLSDTFTVRATDSRLCVSGNRRSSCASQGMYQSGNRAVEVQLIDDEDDDHEDSYKLATLMVAGTAGDEFTASCFQYNGNRILGMTEVLTGVEIRDQAGLLVAVYPSHPVTRRNSLFFSC